MAWILLLAVGGYLAFTLVRSIKDLDAPARKRATNWTLFATVSAIAIVVLARFGLHWLGAAGAAGWAVLRGVGPTVIRLLHDERKRRTEKKPDPQQSQHQGRGAPAAAPKELMSRNEALQVLGIEEHASREQIMVAYRTLIRKVHPDSPGGSTYLATKLNQAKDVLLG